MLNKLKKYVIRKVFERYYGNFIYPFEKTDEIRLNLSPEAQYRYLMDINSFVDSKAFKIEIEGMIRKFYQELSLKPTNDIDISAYRLTLIFIKTLESRLLSLQEEYRLSEANSKAEESLKI